MKLDPHQVRTEKYEYYLIIEFIRSANIDIKYKILLKKVRHMKKIAISIGAVLMMLGMIYYIQTRYFIYEHRQLLFAILENPESAQFMNERLKGGFSVKNGTLCGMVNFKNESGKYNGYVKFYSLGGVEAVIGSEPGSDYLLKEHCG
ncbi:MAG: hypothetical protein LBE30_00230 [Comamonas sp.]|jgi:hypothetical protein|nr:hypothetical protein [Comamonas sp.]